MDYKDIVLRWRATSEINQMANWTANRRGISVNEFIRFLVVREYYTERDTDETISSKGLFVGSGKRSSGIT